MSLTKIEQRGGGVALAGTAGLAWGAMFPVAKHGLRHVDALHMTSIRYGLASLAFLALLAAREGRHALRFDGRAGRLLVLGTLGFAGFNLLSYIGLGMTRPQNAALVIATMPFLALLVLRVRSGARVAPLKLALMVIGFLGVGAVISRGDVGGLLHGGVGGGEALVLVGALCWVLYTLGASEFSGWSALRFTALSATLGTLSILAVTEVATVAGWEPQPTAHDLSAAAPTIAYIVVFGAVVAVLAWNAAVQRLGAPTAVLFNNVVPITAFAIAVAGGYAPNAWEIAGALVAVGALAAVTALNRAASVAAATSAPDRTGRRSRGPRPANRRSAATSLPRASS
jgi:drug/metabolite transporter (DMT)-like permease